MIDLPGSSHRIPAFPLATATVIGALPLGLLYGAVLAFLAFPEGLGSIARMTGLVTFYAAASAAVVGVPFALWLLREPRAGWLRWLAVGAAAGAVSMGAMALWATAGNLRWLLGRDFTPALVVGCAIGIVYAAASALVARWLLSRWLDSDARRDLGDRR